MQIKHADEAELKTEPKQLDKNPKHEVALEHHLACDRVLPERGIDAEVTREIGRVMWSEE